MLLFGFERTFVSRLFIAATNARISVSEREGGANQDSQNPIVQTYRIRLAEYQCKIF